MHPNYLPALELAQRNLRALDPGAVATRSGAELVAGTGGKEFRLRILERDYRIPFPECVVYDVASSIQAGVSPTLIGLHYLITADGTPPTGEWAPWRSIPGAAVYQAAFRRRSIDIILGSFSQDADGLRRAAGAIGATPMTLGDVSFTIQALPRLAVACVLWLGDEEQGADANMLFDAVAPRYLPTEDIAALSTMVALSLVSAKGAEK